MTKHIFIIIALLSILTVSSGIALPAIRVNIIAIDTVPETTASIRPENLRWMLSVLNRDFHSFDNRRFANFILGKIITYTESCQLDPTIAATAHGRARWTALRATGRNGIPRSPLMDPAALNIFLYHDPDSNARSTGAFYNRWISKNGNRQTLWYPTALLHWRVLKNKYEKLVLHEVGHAFGLSHVRPEEPGSRYPSNIMSGDEHDPTLSDPTRGYFFTQSQSAILLRNISFFEKTASHHETDL
ncbi:MAG TPA: hypothetical protein PLM00_02910 [Spirochaetota bacterium]|nr:hypothetical protein [Spirochaetota bacterium]HPN82313.1 hypothetical protein [Spirochaetota bacterium]